MIKLLKIECFRKNITVNNKYLLKKKTKNVMGGLLNLSRHLTFSFFFETIALDSGKNGTPILAKHH